jgi:rSAM/selenodomain-associated transferase 2/rSAM/selenodomain-associated transferase 1
MCNEPLASVIIPVWRDAQALAQMLSRLKPDPQFELVASIVLGDEADYTDLRASRPDIRWVAGPRSRAAQMNGGAAEARGRWLVFLHADTGLPSDWLDVLADAGRRRDAVAGSFRLALDSPAWQARAIEWGVRARVALLGLPYGDQGLFVKRQVFSALGGYRDWPLMEDVDLVRRLKEVGRLVHSRSAVVTSAVRWERDGWVSRSLQNLSLATRFLLGASPARLAQKYFGRKAAAVVMMARAPWTGGKTRLGVAAGDDAAHAELREALLLDTLDVVCSTPNVEHIIACEPASECGRIREFARARVDVVAQRGSDLGQRLTHVFEDVFRLGIESVVVVGSDLPDLPSRLVQDAFIALRGAGDRVVLGPAADGGYYLVGMNRPHPVLFRRIDWSTNRVLAQTLEAAHAEGLKVCLLDQWTDVDSPADLERLVACSSESSARRTRAFAREHLGRVIADG